MNLSVHIEHLVLHGLPVSATDSAAVQAAVQAELTRQLTENGLPLHQNGAFATVRGADVHLPQNTAPDTIGREIGAAIHEGLRA